MTKWKCDRAGATCFKPCYAECEGEDCAPDKCLFSAFRIPTWERVPDEPEQNQKQKQETTLPDWCKVGEWVCIYNHYKKEWEYFKVNETKGNYISSDNGLKFSFCDLMQARLRPYNAEEMRGLVGKVLEHDGNASLVIVYLGNGLLRVGTKWVSAERLIEEGYTIDGKPCGKFEHINDSGEWEA